MRVQLRIVSGSLRGRKLQCTVNPALRPAPQMLREALFSILGTAVPGRPFYDLFAGTGAIGLEALSRGAQPVVFVERDFRVAGEIEHHLQAFGVAANPHAPFAITRTPMPYSYVDDTCWTLSSRVATRSLRCRTMRTSA